jgi:hypothetical protein
MSGDPEQEYFADGMVEEIITALSGIRWLFVIARNSTFTHKGQAVDVKEVGRELGVRYVLEGSVRKAGGRVRITAQLIEAETGTHLWPTVSTARWRTCSIFRTRSRRGSPGSSSRRYTLRKLRALPTARRPISPPSTPICAPLRSLCPRWIRFPRPFVCSIRQSHAIRITVLHLPGLQSAACASASMAQALIAKRTAAGRQLCPPGIADSG